MTYLKVKVHPDSKQDRVIEKAPDSFELFVRAPAEAGRANRAIRTLLAAHLGLSAGKLAIVKGAHSPSKIVAVRS